MFRPPNLRATIDGLHAHVAVLDNNGAIVEVNEGWRRFGKQRNATSDYVGLNYVGVCEDAFERGDAGAKPVADGLLRLMRSHASSYGVIYRCAELTFRMSARRIVHPDGGIIVAHQNITALTAARRERNLSRRRLYEVQRDHAARVENAHEELGQRLTAISLAAAALENGADVADAITIIKLAVEEARQELKLLRYQARQAPSNHCD